MPAMCNAAAHEHTLAQVFLLSGPNHSQRAVPSACDPSVLAVLGSASPPRLSKTFNFPGPTLTCQGRDLDFRRSDLDFRRSDLNFPRSDLDFLRSDLNFSRSDLNFSRSDLNFSRSDLNFLGSPLHFQDATLSFQDQTLPGNVSRRAQTWVPVEPVSSCMQAAGSDAERIDTHVRPPISRRGSQLGRRSGCAAAVASSCQQNRQFEEN